MKDVKEDVDDLNRMVAIIDKSVENAHKRLDRFDAQSWAIWLLLLGSVAKMFFDVIGGG